VKEVEGMKNLAYKTLGKSVISDGDDGLLSCIEDYQEPEEEN